MNEFIWLERNKILLTSDTVFIIDFLIKAGKIFKYINANSDFEI